MMLFDTVKIGGMHPKLVDSCTVKNRPRLMQATEILLNILNENTQYQEGFGEKPQGAYYAHMQYDPWRFSKHRKSKNSASRPAVDLNLVKLKYHYFDEFEMKTVSENGGYFTIQYVEIGDDLVAYIPHPTARERELILRGVLGWEYKWVVTEWHQPTLADILNGHKKRPARWAMARVFV